jgi:hypothetical protein
VSKELAIVRDPGYGMRDAHRPVLWFDVRFGEASGALQIFSQPEADKIIEDFGVRDVADLDGRPCFIEFDGMTVKFIKAAKL